MLSQIIESGKINERQYIKIYGRLEDFENEYKGTLYRSYYELGSTSKDFSQINTVFDIVDSMFSFGKERQLSLLKVKTDELITVDLTENELEQFKFVKYKIKNFLNVFDNYIIDRNTGIIRNWPKIVEEIYDNGL